MADEQKQNQDAEAKAKAEPKAEPMAMQNERTIVVNETEETRRSRGLAEAMAEAAKLRMDETVPGGRFQTADGRMVDCNGKELKD